MQPITSVRWKEEEEKRRTTVPSSCLPRLLTSGTATPCPLPWPQAPTCQPASTLGLFTCLCCIAFARQFPLLLMDHCSFLLLHWPLLTPFFLSLLLGPSCSSPFAWKIQFLYISSSPPPPLLNMALTGREAGLFLHVCQVLFLFHPTPLSFLDLCITMRLCMPLGPALCHSILLSLLAFPWPWCQVWGLRSVPKCLQSTELQTSLQHFF